MNNVLVVGGGGYIGSHTCLDLSRKGYFPVVYDNFSNGHREFVQWGPMVEGDIRDRDRLDEVFRIYRPAAVVHFAALIEVGESVKEPLRFYENNVAGTVNLLAAADAAGCRRIVFSSTCATYGMPVHTPMSEDHPQVPISPYGRTKLIVETVLDDLCAHAGFRAVVLRYFNAAGADPEGRIGEWHQPETHAVPLIVETALGRRRSFSIFGDDYETRDGTCVRDFVHVLDLADAHTRAVEHLIQGGESAKINLGTGTGTTVKELISSVRHISGRDFEVEISPRRPGDAAVLVADNARAARVLGWTPRHDLDSIIRTAWQWHAARNVDLGAASPSDAASLAAVR